MRIIFHTVFGRFLAASVIAAAFSAPFVVSATAPVDGETRSPLAAVYAVRGDLQRFFDAETWQPLGLPQTGDLADLEDWAARYGYREHPVELRRYALAAVYAVRGDLQRFFDAETWQPLGLPQTGDLADLEDWAARYGYREHLVELSGYAPQTEHVLAPVPEAVPARQVVQAPVLPPALVPIDGVPYPVLRAGTSFDFSTVTASKILVIDPLSRRVILSKDADVSHPAASLTKLMTAFVVLENKVPFSRVHQIIASDEVGGARLRVSSGTPLTIEQLFMTMLVGSANNTALALSRSTGAGTAAFVEEMNATAATLGLSSTRFVDPSGIETGNVTTAQDAAALLTAALEKQPIRKAASTAQYAFVAEGTSRDIKNTNGLLVDPDNGLYVLGGKTGYLIESKWNLAVQMRGMNAATQPPLIVVTLGSVSQPDSFKDSERIARWVWANAAWTH